MNPKDIAKTALKNAQEKKEEKSLSNKTSRPLVQKVFDFVSKHEESLRKSSGVSRSESARRIMEQASVIISSGPSLASCAPKSIIQCVLQAISLDLDLSPTLGYVYFIPRGKNLTMQISYQGLIELVYRTGKVTKIEARCVYLGDKFEYEYGMNPKLIHEPKGNSNNEEITHAYAIAWMRDTEQPTFTVLDDSQIESLRQRSQGQGEERSGAWAEDFHMMAKAKVVRKLVKFLPKSIQRINIFINGEENEYGTSGSSGSEILHDQEEEQDAIVVGEVEADS
jgi:recombination protein RecT